MTKDFLFIHGDDEIELLFLLKSFSSLFDSIGLHKSISHKSIATTQDTHTNEHTHNIHCHWSILAFNHLNE
jgi:hypothetical protein